MNNSFFSSYTCITICLLLIYYLSCSKLFIAIVNNQKKNRQTDMDFHLNSINRWPTRATPDCTWYTFLLCFLSKHDNAACCFDRSIGSVEAGRDFLAEDKPSVAFSKRKRAQEEGGRRRASRSSEKLAMREYPQRTTWPTAVGNLRQARFYS